MGSEGGPFPISGPDFASVQERKSHCLSDCPAQILIPFPFCIVLLLMNTGMS